MSFELYHSLSRPWLRRRRTRLIDEGETFGSEETLEEMQEMMRLGRIEDLGNGFSRKNMYFCR